jgi:glycosyltransferase involved in cell wall biosynthesis
VASKCSGTIRHACDAPLFVMSSRPLVSILTPSLNQAQFAEESILSILRQDYPEIEQVVVDGGSTDGTLEILRRYESGRLRLIVTPGGHTHAVNVAFEHARGSIIGWLNTDDAFVSTDVVSRVVDEFERDAACVAVYGDGLVVDGGGRILRHVCTSARRLRRRDDLSPLVQPSVFLRRSAVAAPLLREELRSSIDYELWLRLSRTGRFRKLRRPLAIDRETGRRITRDRWSITRDEAAALAAEYGLRPRPPRVVDSAERWIRRLRGLPALLTIERDTDFAFVANLDSRRARATRQLLRRQASFEHG